MIDLEGVHIISDDILIHGTTIKEHNERLEPVVIRVRQVNLKQNPQNPPDGGKVSVVPAATR